MATSTKILDSKHKLLSKLEQQASNHLFTNIQKAQNYLAEMSQLLQEYSNQDFELSYNLFTAIVENRLYNYDLSVRHFELAIDLLKARGDANQLAEAYIDYSGTLINTGDVDGAYKRLEDARKILLV